MSDTVNLATPTAVDGRAARWLRMVWPLRCLVCGECGDGDGDGGRELCHACAASLPWNRYACLRCALPLPAVPGEPAGQVCGRCLRRPPPLDEVHAACIYGTPLDRLLPRLKFHHDLAAGRLLANLMATAFAPLPLQGPAPAALIPIPLHATRLRRRGYDQALELARPLARQLGLPLVIDVLRRGRETAPQSRLDAAQRRRNLHGAFQTTGSTTLPPHVVLVDDVMTTGATLHAAAIALRRAGVARVDAWVCARVP